MSEPDKTTSDNTGGRAEDTTGGSAADGVPASDAAGKRRGAVRMTAFAPYAAKRAVALEPGRSTAVRIEAGRRAVRAASGQAAHVARAARAAVALRKAAAAAGAGVGLAALSMGSYALGRRTERRAHGPVTRLTRGRF